MQVGSGFKNDKNLCGGGSICYYIFRGASVQLSEPISTSEKQPYQLKMFAVTGGKKNGLLEVSFKTKKSVSSVTLLFLKGCFENTT